MLKSPNLGRLRASPGALQRAPAGRPIILHPPHGSAVGARSIFFTGSDGRGSVPHELFLLLRLQGVECDFAELLLQFSNLLRMSAQPVEELFLVLNARANEICRGLRAAVE